MLTLRQSDQRGHSQLSWLKSRHTFSFDRYFDPDYMSFGPLRVINEDWIAPGGGFGTHPHKDMEIITYVIEGQLQHRDSLGTGSIISAGEIQKMSAGTGIMHSEFNASDEKPVHLLQIWIMPDTKNLKPKYEQERFTLKPGELKLLGSCDGDGLVSIRQKVKLHALALGPGDKFNHDSPNRDSSWIQLVKGECLVSDRKMKSGDGAAIIGAESIAIESDTDTELLIFDFFN